MDDTEREIVNILNANKIDDLKRFLNKRGCINDTNQYLSYAFHLIQSAGILTVSIGQAYNDGMIVWIGVGLNTIASVIHIWTQDNRKISKTMMMNLKAIKAGNYLDEAIIDVEADEKSEGRTPATPHKFKEFTSMQTLQSLRNPSADPLSEV